jgi:signal peptidase I
MAIARLTRWLAIVSLAGLSVLPLLVYQPRLAVVSSPSMRPTLAPGDLALVIHVEPQTITVGDVILYQRTIPFTRIDLVMHRVVSRHGAPGGAVFKTKGDAHEQVDGWDVLPREVLGVVVLVLPQLGRPLLFVQRNLIPLAVILVGLSLLLLASAESTPRTRLPIGTPQHAYSRG